MSFAAIPLRTNGPRIEAGWFNALRAAGILVEPLTTETAVIANNTAVATNVTDLLFSSASYKAAKVQGALRRKTDTGSSEVLGYLELFLIYSNQDAVWRLVSVREESYSGAVGVTFTVTSGGQVQYTSTNISGANYVGEFKFKAEVLDV